MKESKQYNWLEHDFINYKVIKRDGSIAQFDPNRIEIAVSKAFIAVNGTSSTLSPRLRSMVDEVLNSVIDSVLSRLGVGGSINIESIQDRVEIALMRAGNYAVAKEYILYRDKRNIARATVVEREIIVVDSEGNRSNLDKEKLISYIESITRMFPSTDSIKIYDAIIREIYSGISSSDLIKSLILVTRSLIELDPEYSYVAAAFLLKDITNEVLGNIEPGYLYRNYLKDYIKLGIEANILDKRMSSFDLDKLSAAIDESRDFKFQYLGLQILYDRYFLHIEEKRIELPQIFFMRVAMGLCLEQADSKEDTVIEFYNCLSNFLFINSTPTLFNSGTIRPQLSSCFLTSIPDSLAGIYECIKDNALLSKYAGGLGNDWTNVRALGSVIKGTNGKSQGIVPFIKVASDTSIAVNQGGKRNGALCAYLEVWHKDIEEFLDLRKNTGDDRRRTHDMNTACWVCDLFMERIMEDGDWYLFSPSDVPDLHSLYGQAFKSAYIKYEEMACSGKIKNFKKMPAKSLWRKMLTMLFETGHPWITFKDPCNIRSPQKHDGVVKSSNLCTEITLNTSDTEVAVCNLGSINLAEHLKLNGQGLDVDKLKSTIFTAIKALDNVLGVNYYSIEKARYSNKRHRPIGIGTMGFQECLYSLGISYASDESVEFADKAQELISYYSILASTYLAEQRGVYDSYKNSLWDQGILPHDSQELLAKERSKSEYYVYDSKSRLDWSLVRSRIKEFGMRHSNCLAIAPNATTGSIFGVTSSIEPNFQNVFVKSNLSGEFTVVNKFLVQDLKELGLWDEVMVSDIKYFEGSIQNIERIPNAIKSLYLTAFEIDPKWLIKAAAKRMKWIDQSQSLNLYIMEASGKKLDEIYKFAWIMGLKTTYYLRSKSASNVEKYTISSGELNKVSSNINEASCDSCQ